MTAIYRWLWNLGPGNPVMQRVVFGASRRPRDMWVRTGYLMGLIALLIVGLIASTGLTETLSLTDLAKNGTWIFVLVAYGQVALICLLAPLFMAGAIAEEQAGETIDILLTTPLSNAQIVLGSLMGRLLLVLALLLSGLPLFAVLLIFGGVPAGSVFVAFAVAAVTAVFVGAVAITLAVLRIGGRRAVFTFIVLIISYLALTYGADQLIRFARGTLSPPITAAPQQTTWSVNPDHQPQFDPTTPGIATPGLPGETPVPEVEGVAPREQPPGRTTWLTPLHPLLVLEASINSANYRPPPAEAYRDTRWLTRAYHTRPLGTFTLLTLSLSAFMLMLSATQLRAASQGQGLAFALRRALQRVISPLRRPRRSRTVWHNPIAWREARARASGPASVLGRWAFTVLSVAAVIMLLLGLHHGRLPSLTQPGQPPMPDTHFFRNALLVLLMAQTLVIVLVALYISAGCVSREREDGTLDLLLTTPITPEQYIWGKLKGLVSFVGVMLLAPVLSVALVAVYVQVALYREWETGLVPYMPTQAGAPVSVPLLLPEVALCLPLILVPFVGMCIFIGMSLSIRARGVLGAVAPAVGIVALLSLVTGFCGLSTADAVPWFGPFFNAFSPVASLIMLLNPWQTVYDFEAGNPVVGRWAIVLGSLAAAAMYSFIIWSGMQAMVRSFDQSVRNLTGTT